MTPVVQWLSICISKAGLLPDQETKILMQLKRKKKKKGKKEMISLKIW